MATMNDEYKMTGQNDAQYAESEAWMRGFRAGFADGAARQRDFIATLAESQHWDETAIAAIRHLPLVTQETLK